MGSGVRESLLVFALVAPDLLARQAQLFGDGTLLDVLRPGLGDGAAERDTGTGSLGAGREVGVSRRDNGRHRVGHLRIMTRTQFMMPRQGVPCNLLAGHALGCVAT